ncbi:MGMT family protein [Chlamydiifrater phoenicopteri]|uniref:MGMT family protein n=1 Tax=Chlamydiifrater phoenicopteri TaxID=2681469 RepID=UPI001BD01145|nr:MGMT family protein [Chlamydiifrater phoenicopteri]
MFSSPSKLELVSKQTKKILFQTCSQGLVMSSFPSLRVVVRFDKHVPIQSFLARSPLFDCLFLGSSAHQPMIETVNWLISYSNKTSQDLPRCFKKTPLTPIQRLIFDLICTIPFGEALSSKELAKQANVDTEEIDTICNTNPLLLFIPCHRVRRDNYPEKIKEFYKDLLLFEQTTKLTNP